MPALYNIDPLQFYLHEVRKIPPLTKSEETDLLQQVRTQDEQAEFARKRLIEANLSLVVSIAGRYSSAGVSMLDLIQEGNQGLLRAVNTFTEGSGTFVGYATTCIEDVISEAIAESHSATE